MMNRLQPAGWLAKQALSSTKRLVSTTLPDPKKLTVVSQYAIDTYDFSFLPPDYSVEFVEIDRIKSKEDFIKAMKSIGKDRVVVNFMDSCDEEANAKIEKYINASEAEELDNLEKKKDIVKTEKSAAQSNGSDTFFKVCGLTAIEWYNRLGLAFTGSSAHNFAVKKTHIKAKGVPTPKFLVVNREKGLWGSIGKDSSEDFPLKFPVLVKPLNDYGGSTYIQEEMKCKNIDELTERVDKFPVPDILLEEFIKGEEYECFAFQEAASKMGIKKAKAQLRKLSAQKKRELEGLARLICKKKNMASSDVAQIYEELEKRSEQLAENALQGKIEQPAETACLVTDPQQVVLPSTDSFQHEEIKWRYYAVAHEKITGDNSRAGVFVITYRPVRQEVFEPASQHRQSHTDRFTKSIIRKLRTTNGILKLQKDRKIRDAYLNIAIRAAAKKAWKILQHDGFFRFDNRVVEDKVIPPAPILKLERIVKKAKGKLHKLPQKTLQKFLPQYKFSVNIIDANPYCAVYSLPRTYTDADKLLRRTPKLSQKLFLERTVRAGIERELHRRKALLQQEVSKGALRTLKKEYL